MPRPRNELRTLGSTGLPVWSGNVYDEISRELAGDRGRRQFREMSEQDPIIGGVLLGVEMLARQVSWSLKPADDSAQAEEVAEFIDGAITDMAPTFGSTLSEILSMIVYGWSWLEILYKKRGGLDLNSTLKSSHFDDGKIGWAGWAIRSQETLERWEFDGENDDTPGIGELVAMHQLAPPKYKTARIPRAKSLHFKIRSRRENPEGVSLLRNAWRPWYMKKNIEVIEGIGIERDLAGLPVLWAPPELFNPDAPPEDKALFAVLQKIVTSIKRDEQEGILMPLEYSEDGKNPLYKLELLSTGGERQFDTSQIINRYDERIAMSMMADFILMGHESVGSYALSSSKTGLFSTALSAMLDIITEEINDQAIPRLTVLNGWPLKRSPTIQHGKVEAADLQKLGDFLNKLSSSGMAVFPNVVLEKFLLETAGLPGSSEIEEIGEENPDVDPAQPGGKVRKIEVRADRDRETQLPREVERQGRRAANEPKKGSKHFTPLPTRVAKIAGELQASMDAKTYRTFLTEVMVEGKFSRLRPEFQQAIQQAESA